MARKSIIVSDISGREIRDEKDAAKVAITYADARRGRVELDVLASEVNDLASKGNKVAVMEDGVSLQHLVDGLNALGVGPRDIISILQAIKAAGALQADIEVM